MKKLTNKQVIGFCLPTVEEKTVAGRTYVDLLPVDVACLSDSIEATQQFPSMIITADEKPVYHLWYSITGEVLNIEAVVKLSDQKNPRLYYEAAEALAKNFGCKFLRFQTMLSGAVALGFENGFRVEGVLLIKNL